MGYSVRTDGWRYTEWVAWNQTTLAPIWSDVVARELYVSQLSIYVIYQQYSMLHVSQLSAYVIYRQYSMLSVYVILPIIFNILYHINVLSRCDAALVLT